MACSKFPKSNFHRTLFSTKFLSIFREKNYDLRWPWPIIGQRVIDITFLIILSYIMSDVSFRCYGRMYFYGLIPYSMWPLTFVDLYPYNMKGHWLQLFAYSFVCDIWCLLPVLQHFEKWTFPKLRLILNNIYNFQLL